MSSATLALGSRRHGVVFYDPRDTHSAAAVSADLGDHVRKRECLLAIATPVLLRAFRERFDAAEGFGSTVLLDAGEVLGRIMAGGALSYAGFSAVIEPLLRPLWPTAETPALHIFGEMVGLLWTEGRHSDAISLEGCWNTFLADCPCRLLCAYGIDVMGPEFEMGAVDGVLCAHTHVLPCGAAGDLDIATDRALYDTLGQAAEQVRRDMRFGLPAAWPDIPAAEARILWLRRHLPLLADEIVARARDYYDAFQRVHSSLCGGAA